MFLFVDKNAGILFLSLDEIIEVINNEIMRFSLNISRIWEVNLER